MNKQTEKAAAWVYGGVWGILTRWIRVPGEPPHLPVSDEGGAGEWMQQFRPDPAFLRYLKFLFWLSIAFVEFGIVFTWLILTITVPIVGAILFIPALALAIIPATVSFIALHLRYDTTWYVMNDRSIRIRRGVWIIRETTITFENIQNVTVTQGPLQRWFGIANVLIQTAGGGGGSSHGKGEQGRGSAIHMGLVEGMVESHRIRDMFLAKMRRSRGAGLGDEHAHEHRDHVLASAAGPRWTAEHVAALREIRREVAGMSAAVA